MVEVNWINQRILLEGKEQEKKVCLQFSNAVGNLQASKKHKYLSCEDIVSGPYHCIKTILRASPVPLFL